MEVINGITDEVYGTAEMVCQAHRIANARLKGERFRVELRGDTYLVFVEHELEA